MVILPTEKRIDWKRPPFVVLALVVVNLVLFIVSSSQDAHTYTEALTYYDDRQLFEQEWPAYKDYRLKSGDITESELDELKNLQPLLLKELMVFDEEFNLYLEQTISFYTRSTADQNQWLSDRQQLNNQVNSLSSRAFGLNTQQFSVVDLVTHQFLHGGWSHLIGNMLFLFICGFAVEASLGSRRFFVYYLIGGFGGGLFFYLTHLFSDTSRYLIGASGSISAALAMYVTLFKLRKIEFFYWLYIFVGYFKAPAIWLLPFYILVEVVQWLTNSDSNVAYGAHVGGFIAGYLLITFANRWQQDAIDSEYIEEDQNIDKPLQDLDKVYRAISDYNFERALSNLDKIYDPANDELVKIKLNLVRALGKEKEHEFIIECVQKNLRLDRLDEAIEKWWQALNEQQQLTIDGHTRAQIAMRLVGMEHYKPCELIIGQLMSEGFREPILGKLARRLAHFYERQGVIAKRNELNNLADSLMQAKSMTDNARPS